MPDQGLFGPAMHGGQVIPRSFFDRIQRSINTMNRHGIADPVNIRQMVQGIITASGFTGAAAQYALSQGIGYAQSKLQGNSVPTDVTPDQPARPADTNMDPTNPRLRGNTPVARNIFPGHYTICLILTTTVGQLTKMNLGLLKRIM